MILPPYKGGIFRGAFGFAFRKVVCPVLKNECSSCMLKKQCLYTTLFEPQPPVHFKDLPKFKSAPPPYILNPPLTSKQVFHSRETMEFDMVLTGKAIEAIPYIVYAFHELGKYGIGKERGKYEIVAVYAQRQDSDIKIYDGESQTLNICSDKNEFSPVSEDEHRTLLTLEFITPLRLKNKGKLVHNLTFPIFFKRLGSRISLLQTFYGTGTTSFDLNLLNKKAQDIEICEYNLHWYEWSRYSGRQKTDMNLGGLKGTIKIKGELGQLMPLIRFGELFNAGQGTSFGLGRYILS